MVKNIQNYRTVLILNLLSALSAPGKSARLGGFEGIGVLVRVILVYKSGFTFFLTAKAKKLMCTLYMLYTDCSKYLQIF